MTLHLKLLFVSLRFGSFFATRESLPEPDSLLFKPDAVPPQTHSLDQNYAVHATVEDTKTSSYPGFRRFRGFVDAIGPTNAITIIKLYLDEIWVDLDECFPLLPGLKCVHFRRDESSQLGRK